MLSTHPLAWGAALSCSFVLGQLALAEPRGAGSSLRKAPDSCTHPCEDLGRAHRGLILTGVALGARESHHSTCEPPQWQQPRLPRLCETSQETKQNRGNLQGKKLLFHLGNLSFRSTGFQRRETKTLGGKGWRLLGRAESHGAGSCGRGSCGAGSCGIGSHGARNETVATGKCQQEGACQDLAGAGHRQLERVLSFPPHFLSPHHFFSHCSAALGLRHSMERRCLFSLPAPPPLLPPHHLAGDV